MTTQMDMASPLVSVITAVHNQRAMNELFWQYLHRNTHHPFELIIIDNASSDGSADFFQSVGATVIRNTENYSYPRSQNQGIAIAKGQYLAFLNNDIVVSENWDQRLINSLQINALDVLTCCGIERVESFRATQKLKRRWKRIRNFLNLFRTSQTDNAILRLMHYWMYGGQWNAFCTTRYQQFKHQVAEGFVGNTVMLTRRALDLLGVWDEKVQAGDFDLYLRTKVRSLSQSDIKPMHLALDVYNHHYIRLTMKGKYPPFADRARLIEIEDKWTPAELRLLDDAKL